VTHKVAYPRTPTQRLITSQNHRYGVGWAMNIDLTSFASATWSGSGRAVYVPFRSDRSLVVTRMFWANGGTVTGNADVGIYNGSLTRLVSSGSTAQSGATTLQYVDITDTVLTPGSYYLAFVADGSTFLRHNAAVRHYQSAGIVEEAAALPLPATATPTALTVAAIPVFGVEVQGDA
jgi:hypothetical protein